MNADFVYSDISMKVAIKFRGGCDPDSDRVEYWEEIRRAAGNGIEWVQVDSGCDDAVLVIRGCSKTCPQDNIPRLERAITVMDDSLNADEVIRLLGACLAIKTVEPRTRVQVSDQP